MLERKHIAFKKIPSPVEGVDAIQLIGRINLQFGVTVFSSPQVNVEKKAEDEVVRLVWKILYGDLMEPIFELERQASRSVPWSDYPRLRELCDKINGLLAVPKA